MKTVVVDNNRMEFTIYGKKIVLDMNKWDVDHDLCDVEAIACNEGVSFQFKEETDSGVVTKDELQKTEEEKKEEKRKRGPFYIFPGSKSIRLEHKNIHRMSFYIDYSKTDKIILNNGSAATWALKNNSKKEIVGFGYWDREPSPKAKKLISSRGSSRDKSREEPAW